MLNEIKAENIVQTMTSSRVVEIINRWLKLVAMEPRPVLLARGSATIPIQGVDVPFHSSHLESGVPATRRSLRKHIPEPRLEVNRLVGKYIPNLTAQPFEVSKEYFENTANLTRSAVLKGALEIVRQLFTTHTLPLFPSLPVNMYIYVYTYLKRADTVLKVGLSSYNG